MLSTLCLVWDCRQPRQGFARPSALLTSSPQQPATVRGCPVTIDASSTGSINLRLKLCAQWSDVAKVIDDFGDSLGASNVAYALFRLGCLYCFMSEQRKQGTVLLHSTCILNSTSKLRMSSQ